MPLRAHRRCSHGLWLALSLAGVACQSETSVEAAADKLATEVCDAVVACDCKYPNGAQYEHCVGQIGVTFEAAAQQNLVDGLSFDGDCADRTASNIAELGCGLTFDDPDAACAAPCKIWHGPMGVGGTCNQVNGFDNCKQGLVCGADSVCIKPCAEPKLPEIGEGCAPFLGCVEGAYCDANTDLLPFCKPLPLVNQGCTDPQRLCAEGLICEPDQRICAPLPGLRDACIDGTCAADLYCDATKTPAVCAGVPTLGQACSIVGCQAPYVCNNDQICAAPPPLVCGYYNGLPE